jgi:hypothetical protein
MAPALCNLLLPGCGLLLRDQLLAGLLLAAVDLLVLGSLAVVLLLGEPALRLGGAAVLLAVHLLLAVGAWLGQSWVERPGAAQAADLTRLHAASASAWLGGDQAAALTAARELVRLARRHPGAWELLSLVAADSDPRLARQAGLRAARLRRA